MSACRSVSTPSQSYERQRGETSHDPRWQKEM